nr:GNAT family N-acetyltransferase [Pseudomonas sp. 8AS]
MFHWHRDAPWHLGAVDGTDRPRLLQVWEAAVRATHHFLGEEDIQFYKRMLCEQYFDLVRLACLRDGHGRVLGFSGTAEDRLEMLFVDPDQHGRGLGKALLRHAIAHDGVRLVDVNEQNPQALAFYLSQGFEQIGRSALDGADRPYPLLHLRLRGRA